MTRSTMLRRLGIGSGAVVVGAGAGIGFRTWEQGVFAPESGIAYEPWRRWRTYTGPLALVAAAVLCANAHNLQPWIFHVADGRIDLFADPARNLGAADPLLREMDVSLGCALENLVLAAEPNGYSAAVHLLPDAGMSAHIARVGLSRREPHTSKLFEQIPYRHTNRGPFDTARPVSDDMLKRVDVTSDPGSSDTRIFWFTTTAQRQSVGKLLVEATEAFIADDAQSRASYAGIRFDMPEIQRRKDGLTLDTQGLTDTFAGFAKLLPASSRAAGDKFWLASTRDTHVATAQAYGMIAVRNARERSQRLSGGRVLQRIHLSATAQGLALHHMNQLTEREDREQSLGLPPRFGSAVRALVPAPWQTLVTFRLGYPLRAAHLSPRRSVVDVVVS
jgi:hypothetical protein